MCEAKPDPRIDAYIERAAPFAQPILRHLRALVQEACPGVIESIKWGFPHFSIHGSILFSMAAFQRHCACGFWSCEIADRAAALGAGRGEAMGQMGRVSSLADLPTKRTLTGWLQEGAALAAAGKSGRPRPVRAARPELEVPTDLGLLLAGNPRAHAVFDSFPPSARREYLEWIAEARRPATRATRLAQTLEWVAAGKRRNWQHESC